MSDHDHSDGRKVPQRADCELSGDSIPVTTILHLSDIHRTPSATISNVVLLDSLLRDLSRQEVQSLDLIVVSGDLVQGVSCDDLDADAKLTAQYAEAADFLCALARELLENNRERIVLVPGNHDINWHTSSLSMTALPASQGENRKRQVAQVSSCRSKLRWSWETLGLFHISDEALYAKRMGHFAALVAQFYEGKRTFPEDDQRQYGLHVFSDLRLGVLAFNSCWNNDHLQYVGQIRNECIAHAATEVRNLRIQDHLLMAVWHHNVRGLPSETGYLDYRCLEYLLDVGVTLGLHGHQHQNEVITEHSRLMHERRMLIVSAGSLCAGPSELPSGERRSYNIIRILGDNTRVSVTTRVSIAPDPAATIWADSGQFESALPKPIANPPPAIVQLDKVSDLIREKRPGDALVILKKLPDSPSAKRLLLECYLETSNMDEIIRQFHPPSTTTEAMAVLDAAWEVKNKDVIGEVLADAIVRDSQDPAMREMRNKYQRLMKHS